MVSVDPSMSMDGLLEICQECGNLLDSDPKGGLLGQNDVEIAARSVKWDARSGNKGIPADRIIRYNFLEALIRLAQYKFIKNAAPLCSTMLEAVTMLVENFTSVYYRRFDPAVWREEVLWAEQNDLALKM